MKHATEIRTSQPIFPGQPPPLARVETSKQQNYSPQVIIFSVIFIKNKDKNKNYFKKNFSLHRDKVLSHLSEVLILTGQHFQDSSHLVVVLQTRQTVSENQAFLQLRWPNNRLKSNHYFISSNILFLCI